MPNRNWVKGMKPVNPTGRPKGTADKSPISVKKRVIGKWRTHPVDKLVTIANFIQATNPEFSGKIWMRLLDSIEAEERKNKSSQSPVPISETTIPESDDKLLEELEQNGFSQTTSSKDSSMATGTTQISPEASPETDLREHKE